MLAINGRAQSNANSNVLVNKSYLSAVESGSFSTRDASYLLDNNYLIEAVLAPQGFKLILKVSENFQELKSIL